MGEELEKVEVWMPETPAKPTPARPNPFSPTNLEQKYLDYCLRSSSQIFTVSLETGKAHSYRDGDRELDDDEHSKFGAGLVSVKSSTLTKKRNAWKRCNDGRDSNKKSRKLPMIRNYRPKVVVESKIKQTPKLVKPNHALSKKELSKKRRNGGKNRLKALGSPSKGAEENAFDPNQEPFPRSCKLVLNFTLENTSREDKPVEATSQSSCQVESINQARCKRDLKSILELQHQSDKGREQNIEIIHAYKISFRPKCLQVYHRRIFRENQCLSNSRILGPNFPRFFKRCRRRRKKVVGCRCRNVQSVMGIEDGTNCDLKMLESSIELHSSEEVIDSVVQKTEHPEMHNGGGKLMVENSPLSGQLALVPYKVPFGHKKKENLKPKVELDEETMRVWKLLMVKDGCEAFEEESKDKDEWWKEERELFRDGWNHLFPVCVLFKGDGAPIKNILGRENNELFCKTKSWDDSISSLNIGTCGDRHFSPWKGSVVDSVVGVFLSQNVDDTLSSSSFMSLAAQYPHRIVSDVFPCQNFFTTSTGQVMSGSQSSSAFTPAGNFEARESRSLKRITHDDLKGPYASTFGRETEKAKESEDKKLLIRTYMRRKTEKFGKEDNSINWDSLRKAYYNGEARDRSSCMLDSLDWSAVRSAEVDEVSKIIQARGMNKKLALRIKNCLHRMAKDHGDIDLEWLRNVPPDKAKEYLLSIEGLGLKSVECIRLLTLKLHAFPVDRNVGRVAVRLGWVPIEPLPEGIQIHLLGQYPMVNSIQKYLWPRLCTLDQGTLYELHYQMITFGKVFCTKRKPNCNACPMRGECKHFSSKSASARLALPGPQEEDTACSSRLIIDVPPSLELECSPRDIEDLFIDKERPTVRLNTAQFNENLQHYVVEDNIPLQEGDMSKAIVVLTSEAAFIPGPLLKNISRLRTEHQVYSGHCKWLKLCASRFTPSSGKGTSPHPSAVCTSLAAETSEPLEERCGSHNPELENEELSSCNNTEEQDSETISGTLLIPCRTALRGKFPLNGTYFQVNEVFADDESSQQPINVPRTWIWKLPRTTLYCGTSVRAILRGKRRMTACTTLLAVYKVYRLRKFSIVFGGDLSVFGDSTAKHGHPNRWPRDSTFLQARLEGEKKIRGEKISQDLDVTEMRQIKQLYIVWYVSQFPGTWKV